MSEAKPTLEELLPRLKEAEKVLEERIAEARQGDKRVTDARNVYNELCKKVDEAVQALKASAAWGTDWHSQLHPGRAV